MRRDYSIETLQKMQLADNIKQQILELAEQREKEVASVEYEVLNTKHNKRGVTVISNHSKIRTRYNTMIGTLIKHGVTSTWKLPEVREKELQTKEERYGTKYVGDREKARQTKLAKGSTGNGYDGKQYVNIKKAKQTKFERYGDENYVNTEKCKITKLAKGIRGWNNIKGIETKRKIYGPNLEGIMLKLAETCQEKYGVSYPCELPQARQNSYKTKSSKNKYWQWLIKEKFGIDMELEYRIGKCSYDLRYKNLLIEINPTWSHNSTYGYALLNKWSTKNKPKGSLYHYSRAQNAIQHGYHCITVWDWDNIDKVLTYIGECLNGIEHKTSIIQARKCVITEIDMQTVKQFQMQYHLQGPLKSQQICLGLFDRATNELVQVMTFGKTRHGRKSNSNEYELLRLCSSTYIAGGAEKLFKYFIEHWRPQTIVSYCDLSKFTGKVYEKLGFKLVSTSLGEHWQRILGCKDWKHITGNLLLRYGVDILLGTNYGKGTNNRELMLQEGFAQIFDCGQQTWIWQSNSLK